MIIISVTARPPSRRRNFLAEKPAEIFTASRKTADAVQRHKIVTNRCRIKENTGKNYTFLSASCECAMRTVNQT